MSEREQRARIVADLSRPAGFPRQYRLTKTDDFSSVFGFRKAIRGQSFMLHYRHPQGDELAARVASGMTATPRLGVIVAKRLLKRAVHRNLVRRIAREAFRHLRPGMPPADIVLRLMVKPALPLDRQQLAKELRELLLRLYWPSRRKVAAADAPAAPQA